MKYSYEEKWKTVSSLQESGQSFTYIAQQKDNDKLFVLKRNRNPDRKLRFHNEIKALLELKHPNIVEIIDYDFEGDNPWYVQEYFPQGDLGNFIRNNPDLDWELGLDIFIQVCEGLAYCHSKGIYHRDIKPANIFLKENGKTVVIGDFGLCWFPLEEQRATGTGEAVGSRYYIPPEYRNGKVDLPTSQGDIYSLGKVLYFEFSGGRSFDRENEYREDDWNIVRRLEKPTPDNPNFLYLEHINLILDQMITTNPDERIEISLVLEKAKIAKRLISEGFNLLEGARYAPCNYCGLGYYQAVAKTEGSFSGFLGLGVVATTEINPFRALVCDHCGNVQIFRMTGRIRDWLTKLD